MELTLAQINAADRGSFVRLLDGVYADAPWVAEQAWTRR
jgi:2-oxo-4-hydroxy-4-carboxy--5-ureidoimidazoline (OHCU) decarboxylase